MNGQRLEQVTGLDYMGATLCKREYVIHCSRRYFMCKEVFKTQKKLKELAEFIKAKFRYSWEGNCDRSRFYAEDIISASTAPYE